MGLETPGCHCGPTPGPGQALPEALQVSLVQLFLLRNNGLLVLPLGGLNSVTQVQCPPSPMLCIEWVLRNPSTRAWNWAKVCLLL